MAFTMTSPDFREGGDIPSKFTCDGPDLNPILVWQDPPADTQSFALIMDDPDAPRGTWVHWVLYNLPAETQEIGANFPKTEMLPNGALHGLNDFRKNGYGGPCPPSGPAHHYFFKLYAIDTKLSLPAGSKKTDLEKAMQGHILGETKLMGKYGR